MKMTKNIILQGKHHKPILVDVIYKETHQPKKVIIFCHGYKGFKDWGAWNSMAQTFAKAGFFFIKFNFSHNGGTSENPIDFPDLKAFGNNNYTKELDDLGTVIDWISTNKDFKNEVDLETISLIGHSRGGGIVLLKSNEEKCIKKVITLAGVSNYKTRFPKKEAFQKWKEKGVYYVKNGRNHQEMPHFYQFYEDFIRNENRLNIQKATENLKIPQLIIHGDNDTSVAISEAKKLHLWNPKSEFKIIENANHVFNTAHPWKKEVLSKELEKVTQICIDFLK
ncbi:alpha/beta hydrolase [Polaribacter sp. MSW13]|uniref:Alpha/beta hydrolase n=1 Tax=Polaribacter marinus TaxID=2916838 RepID=A0A9X2AJF7_9FLAO|nr:alpha/beta fold hydrolase [Polaribacter marinus]MCI2229481.1 alpha/beta hydrolase [Polaribacter marinus]